MNDDKDTRSNARCVARVDCDECQALADMCEAAAAELEATRKQLGCTTHIGAALVRERDEARAERDHEKAAVEGLFKEVDRLRAREARVRDVLIRRRDVASLGREKDRVRREVLQDVIDLLDFECEPVRITMRVKVVAHSGGHDILPVALTEAQNIPTGEYLLVPTGKGM